MHAFTLLLPLLALSSVHATGLQRHSQQPVPLPLRVSVHPIVPARPVTPHGHWEFAVAATWYPSFRLATKAFRRIALAQGAYLKAIPTYGHYHKDAVDSFVAHYEKALVYTAGAHEWHNVDQDPIRKAWMAVRLVILDAEMKLMHEEMKRMPPENKFVKAAVKYTNMFVDGVLVAATTVAKLIVEAGKVAVAAAAAAAVLTAEVLVAVAVTTANIAVGIAYGVVYAVGAAVYAAYLGIQYAADLVKSLVKGIGKAANYLWRNWFPIHYVAKDETSNKMKFKAYETIVNEHYGGNWNVFYETDSVGFSIRQSGKISDSANSELQQSYTAEHTEILQGQVGHDGKPHRHWVDATNSYIAIVGDPTDTA